MKKDFEVLKPLKETSEDFEALEKRLKEFFRRVIYWPILKEIGQSKKILKNSPIIYQALHDALFSGRITFNRGTFSGAFNATVTKELRSLGAKWDRRSGTFKIQLTDLPPVVKASISASESKFRERLESIDKTLSSIVPDEIVESFKCSDLFDSTLWKTNKQFEENVKGITVAPQLTPERRKKIADEWQNNMRLWIKDFTKKEIIELRKTIQKSVFAGNRYESAVSQIAKSYGVSERKAKFLARQETALLMTTFEESQYEEAGIKEYIWGCVAGTPAHPVRPAHKKLEGKKFRFDDPPITTAPGEPVRRNNPGQDFNCRCFARPVVNFRKQ